MATKRFQSIHAEAAKEAISSKVEFDANGNVSLTGKPLRNDNVFVTSEVKDITEILPAGLTARKGYEKVIISENEVVNIVSNSYGHLANEDFFLPIEVQLIDAGVSFVKRSINKDNRSFAVDYILNDPKYIVVIKGDKKQKNDRDDKIVPMLRFVNSYDGSSKTVGYFGMFREVCTNGLTIGNKQIGFSIKHKSTINEVILPNIDSTIQQFFDNDFYKIQEKITRLSETTILDVPTFVEQACEATKIFQYAKSEKNPDASLNAQLVIDTINKEATTLGTAPNLWLGYNSLNEILYSKFNKSFEAAKVLDNKVFDFALSLS